MWLLSPDTDTDPDSDPDSDPDPDPDPIWIKKQGFPK